MTFHVVSITNILNCMGCKGSRVQISALRPIKTITYDRRPKSHGSFLYGFLYGIFPASGPGGGGGVLILTRRVGETVMIGDDVTITVLGVKGN